MVSEYFIVKTKTNKFKERLKTLISDIKDKKVLIYGAGDGFLALNKEYKFNETLNIVAIADKKFETDNCDTFNGFKAIKPQDILKQDYDVLLISNENYEPILEYIYNELCLDNKQVETIFKEEIKDERVNFLYLSKHQFSKTLPKLLKKLKNKRVIFYGAGVYLELIKEYFDISSLNVIAIADKKYEIYNEVKDFLGYPTCTPNQILDLKPDYVIISTKFYINIFEFLNEELLKGSKIKIKPLVKKSFITLIKEVWGL